ncbi:hypothetical protein HUT03_04775 [Candidatus Liberibacter africanus]|uniref:Uncharacterized protein n=1 Tax=Candidatus Liberibacter africanus PTSAPSY TaxID=1277257 RepID=A0A0G3I3V3_LIBAF|nr:hypothetical protein [Candidatus Liberibacter africanus]AKK20554.1 hypothetical protein G293_04695 [Candidatus Liberibacter africanus PTSAPSY]QTP64254.1 hypothetical protein HUT03_04775 [Candidatus Liberibacter africanus]
MTHVPDSSSEEPVRKSAETSEKETTDSSNSYVEKTTWRNFFCIKKGGSRLFLKLLITLFVAVLACILILLSIFIKTNIYTNDPVNHSSSIDSEKNSSPSNELDTNKNTDMYFTGLKIQDKKISSKEQENVNNNVNNNDIKSLLEEVSSLKKMISDLNKNYQNIIARLTKTEYLIANPLKNPDTQRIISLLILKNSIDKKGNFLKDEFSVLKPCTSVLMQFSNTKIPTTVEILTQFTKVSEEMIFAGESLDHDSGFTDYLLLQLNRLIKVRLMGENIEGDSITAIIARIENNLKTGDLIKAASEWDKIPEKAKQPGVYLRNAIEAHICSDAILEEEMNKISQNNLS